MIQQISDEIKEMVKIASENITALRAQQNDRVNRTRTHKEFKKDDIVFVLDRSIVEGNPQVLRTKFSPSPYVVVNPSFTTTVVRRLADGFQALYGNNDLKLYKKFDPEFNNLPKEVQKVLMFDFKDFIAEDFSVLTKHDNLSLPTSLDLFIPDENYQDEDANESNENKEANLYPKLDEALINLPAPYELEDEFYAEDVGPSVVNNENREADDLNKLPESNNESQVEIENNSLQIPSEPADQSESEEEEDEENVKRLRYGRRRKVAFDTAN